MLKTTTAAFLCLCALPAFGAGLPEDMARVDLLPGWRTADGTHMAALRVQLAPGWKTYWRAPGDAGIPPRFDFSGSRNVASVSFHWPVPTVFSTNGMTSVGYGGQLILPIEVRPQSSGDARLSAQVDLGVCEEICVPLSVDVAIDLPVAPSQPDSQIRAALADRPLSAAEAGSGTMRCDMAPQSDGISLKANVRTPSMGRGEYAVIELNDPDLWVSEAQISRQGGELSAEVEVVPMGGGTVAFDRGQVRLTVLGDSGAVEIFGCS